MKIGIDLDDTITYAPDFFKVLTQTMSPTVEIHIITRREPGTEKDIARELEQMGIRYHFIKITDQKADYILERGIEVYFDDTDEYFQSLPESVKVFKTREPGNFCFKSGRWFYGKKTGVDIEERRSTKTG